MKRLLLPRLAAALLVLAACSLDVQAPNGLPSQLRVVNAAPGTTTVSAFLNAALESISGPLAFGEATQSCQFVFPTAQSITFVQDSLALASTTVDLQGGEQYTVVLTNVGATYRAVGMLDGDSAQTGNNAWRFINATSTAGDVYVTPPGAQPGPSFLVVGNLGPSALSNDAPVFLQRPATDVRVRLYDVGTTATPRADLSVSAFADSRRTTIVFAPPSGAPGDPGAFQIFPCD